MAVLTLLLAIWTDDLELEFNDFVRPLEFIKIIMFTFLSFVGMIILIRYFRKKNIHETRRKIKYAVITTIAICSYLYIGYFIKAAQNRLINAGLRKNIWNKVTPGVTKKANSLSYAEYKEILKMTRFPAIPESAENISLQYYTEILLPDYFVEVIYYVPENENIREMNYEKGDFFIRTNVKVSGNWKKVTYEESKM